MNEWTTVDNLPEVSDCYIIAWLPKDMKNRKEGCFYAIAYFHAEFGEWDLGLINWYDKEDITVYAWRELPEPYMI